MHKITWSSLQGLHCVFRYVKFLKSVFLTMFKYRGDIAKTGDKSSLCCFFQSNSNTTVVKISKWKLIYMNFIKSKCAWHMFCVRFGTGSRVMPLFFKLLNPYKESFFVFFESQIKLLENSYIDASIVCIVIFYSTADQFLILIHWITI